VLGKQQLQQQLRLVVQLDDRFKIRDRFTLIPAGPGEYRLHSLTYSLAVRDSPDEILAQLLPLLDGQRTVGDVVGDLVAFGPESVHQALGHLLEQGALERVTNEDHGPLSPQEIRRLRPQLAFFSHFVAPADAPGSTSWPGSPRTELELQTRVKRAHVVVFGLGRIGSQLVRALALAGVGKITAIDSEPVSDADVYCDSLFDSVDESLSRSEGARRIVCAANPHVEFVSAPEPSGRDELHVQLEGSEFAVLCRDHFDPAEYEVFNLTALATRTPWTSARMSGFEFHMGPTVLPFATCCFRCFELRQKSNLPDPGEYAVVERFLSHQRLRSETLAFTPGAGLVALEVLKAITWFMTPAACDHLYVLDLLTMQSTLHPMLKIPRCTACGRAGQPRPTIHAWQQSEADIFP
jgi:bacteriocin biosynthesis cyclodehydratase domain-containing protein